MNERLQITFLHNNPSTALEFRIRREASRLDRYYDRIEGCRVVVDIPHDRHRQDSGFHIRIEISVPGPEIVVTHTGVSRSTASGRQNGERSRQGESQPGGDESFVSIREAFAIARRRLEDYARVERGDVKHHAPPPQLSGMLP
jgi:ribosome-associated translation inhibitor RaiA